MRPPDSSGGRDALTLEELSAEEDAPASSFDLATTGSNVLLPLARFANVRAGPGLNCPLAWDPSQPPRCPLRLPCGEGRQLQSPPPFQIVRLSRRKAFRRLSDFVDRPGKSSHPALSYSWKRILFGPNRKLLLFVIW